MKNHHHYHQQIKLSLAIMSLGPLDDKAQIIRFTCYLRSNNMLMITMMTIINYNDDDCNDDNLNADAIILPGRVGEISDLIIQSLLDFNGHSFQ